MAENKCSDRLEETVGESDGPRVRPDPEETVALIRQAKSGSQEAYVLCCPV